MEDEVFVWTRILGILGFGSWAKFGWGSWTVDKVFVITFLGTVAVFKTDVEQSGVWIAAKK